jgi:hypothetical protein
MSGIKSKCFEIAVAVLIAGVVLMPGRSFAQTSLGTSSVAGTVRDPSFQVVPTARVFLLDRLHGTQRETVTNSDGGYQFSGVLPGLYAVKVEQPGFRTTTVDNVQVIIDQAATVDAVLAVGQVSEVVEVNAQGSTPLLDTVSNTLGGVIDNKRVEELPLNGRNFLQLALLVGGTQPSTTTNQTGHNSLTLEVTGNSQWLTGYNINGISTRSPRIGNSSLNLSISAIDQFKIELGFFLPDKGPQGGIIDVLTRSGTNTVHGEVYEFLRNTDLNAYQYRFPGDPVTRDDLHRNQFGFSIGGPVVIPKLLNGKDKFWFFGNYEGTRQTDKTVQRGTTPTLAMFNGDFSTQSPTALIYNPYSYNPTTHTRAPFAGNSIPASAINPLSKALLAYYIPGSNYPLVSPQTDNLAGYPVSTLNDDQFTIRLDTALSQRQGLYIDYSYENSPVVNRNLLPLTGLAFPLEASLAVVQHTMTFGPNMVNIFRIGFDHAYTYQTGEGQSGPPIETQLGIPGTLDPHGIPAISLTGFTGFGNAYSRVGEAANAYQLNEAFNYTKGTHNMAFGAGIAYHRVTEQNSNAGAVGSLSFQPTYTAQLTANSAGVTSPVSSTGSAFADFLLGLPFSGSVNGFQPLHYRYTDYYPYFQDSWRITPNFTLNYGLAWYFSSIPNPQGADALLSHSFDFSTGLLKYSALGQVSPQVIKNDHNNFMPRFGFAWSPGSAHNTTLRAGVGMYYAQLGLNDIQYAAAAPPFTTSVSFTNNRNSNLPANSFGNGVFPVIPLPSLNSSFAANLPAGFSITAIDPNSRTPYQTQWNVSLQRLIGKNDLIQGDYIGNSGHKGTNRYEADQCPFRSDLFCDNTLRPYQRYSAISYVTYNTNTSYEAMLLKYQHQFSDGLTVLANYTFQKALSDAFEPNGPAVNTQISGCRSCDKGPLAYSIPHSFVISTVYDLPFGRGRRFGANVSRPLDTALGGWRLTVIGNLNHGTPLDVITPNTTGSTNTRERANRPCDGNDSSYSSNLRTNGYQYFNPACFATPATGYFGNSGRGIIYTPGVNNWDLSVVKAFSIYERLRFELRGEAFNFFNHVNFTGLDNNTGDIASNKFGKVSGALSPRLIQISGKIVW